ncbi:AfsR/SARP family transcriptional regulator [Nocardia crassostreae]|uniref:AfsR/SARP family transcriptional regulator n=1 Tax=Nocardia crassostreae TaxID=53428 RepID=UPI001471B40C|nr:winged helix-turn-helix domain-containing protein [Nocardia crassostreae]
MESANPPALDLRVLGPVRLFVNGNAIVLPGTKLRALLAVLTLNRRRAVTRTALLRLVWEADPGRSESVVYGCVSSLRTVLHEAGIDDRAVLRNVPAGYLLDIRDTDCDVGRFENACAQGRIACAA